ncbi:MAG: hypothetical protein A2231_12430 [Candidatus Firestonebacteria bacterium RIFOXYA2_FULL_40_8]|nr:MAG: hypothetical protein A2231_12430 [Candidatus Firestonebacteria bacterium RIFOXYA2_FULL_40_8]
MTLAEFMRQAESRLQDKGLTTEQSAELKEHYKNTLRRFYKRKRHQGEEIGPEIITAACNNALGHLEELARQLIVDKEEKAERLNPTLLSKAGMRREFESARTKQKSDQITVLVLISMDLDDFKQVNDNFNHEEGDRILREMGNALAAAVRPDDLVAHYSGDEFGCLLPVAGDKIEPEKLQEKIEEVISRIVEKTQGGIQRPDGQKQEFSVGYRLVTSQESGSFEDYQKDADAAANFSKIIRVLEENRGTQVASADRVIDHGLLEKYAAQYQTEELKVAQALRSFKRAADGLAEALPGISPEDLRKKVGDFFASLVAEGRQKKT